MTRAMQQARSTVCDTVVADWSGLTPHQVHLLHPVGFGAPRHFTWNGYNYLYTAAGLRSLLSAMRAAGQTLAAERLEPKLAEIEQAPTPAQEIGLRACV